MYRYLIAAALLVPQVAWAACPAIPANCPSPTFNIITLAVPVGVASGGTGLSSGTSGGIPGYTASGVLTSSVALTANGLVLGGGPGATPKPMGSLGTTTTLLHGNAAGAPAFAAVDLAAEVGATVLPVANGGTNRTSGTSGGILGYTAAGTLTSSAALGANGLVIGGGAGATPTAITAGTDGQIPVAATGAAPVMQTVGGDATMASTGSLTVSKIGGTAIALGATGTFWPGHSLIGVQTFCASGCTATGGTYTATAGTNRVIIEVVAAGGGSGGCAATDASHGCVGGSAASGSYAKAMFTASFSGITMTVGAAGTAGTNVPGAGGTGGTTSAGALISCPGGTGGLAGVQIATAAFTQVVLGITGGANCTLAGGGTVFPLLSVAGQRSGGGVAANITISLQYPGQSGSTPLGEGVPALYNAAVATSTGTPGTGYGWGAGGSYSDASQVATVGTAGGPSLITVFEYN